MLSEVWCGVEKAWLVGGSLSISIDCGGGGGSGYSLAWWTGAPSVEAPCIDSGFGVSCSRSSGISWPSTPSFDLFR